MYRAELDLDADVFGGCTNGEIFQYILNNLTFDQLIWEFGDQDNPDWVHVVVRDGLIVEGSQGSRDDDGKVYYEPIFGKGL